MLPDSSPPVTSFLPRKVAAAVGHKPRAQRQPAPTTDAGARNSAVSLGGATGGELSSTRDFAVAMLHLRGWRDANLPTYGSIICYDLTLVIAAHVGEPRQSSLKRIYGELPYSECHLRHHLRQLECDDWIRIARHPGDHRNRVIEPTKKFLDAYRAYCALLVQAMSLLPVR